MTPEAAEQALRHFPEYDWLTQSGQQWWAVTEIKEKLGIGEQAIRTRCENGMIPGAVNHGVAVGWRIPRRGLLMFVASLPRGGAKPDAG